MPRFFLFLAGFVLLVAACSDSEAESVERSGLDDPTSTTEPVVVDPPRGALPATLDRVLDGDSLHLIVDGVEEEVRLLGFNAPEGDECYGDESRDALRTLLDGADLALLPNEEEPRDRFGRLLASLFADGRAVSEVMVGEGNAIALQGGQENEDVLKGLESEAFHVRIGMWAADACGPPAPDGIRVLTVEYDPPGRDDFNAVEEWVGIGNAGGEAIDLSGWVVRDESSQHRYVFPDGYAINPDVVLRLRSGCGVDGDGSLYWCASDPVWSNGGDTVILQDRHGNVVDRWAYEGAF